MYDRGARGCIQFGHSARPRRRVAGRYDKVRLLAFGEYIPGIETFPWLRKLLPAGAGRFTAGKGPGVMSLQGPGGIRWRLGPVICYEDILQGFLRGVGQLHPNLLVNLTSDSWFGADTEPWEHLALAVFASVELRVSMVRAVNSGVSALIDPNGRVMRKTYADDPYRNPRAADGIVVSAPVMAGGAHGVRGRGQFVRLPVHRGHADSRGPRREAQRLRMNCGEGNGQRGIAIS